jgi:hypothetical protein
MSWAKVLLVVGLIVGTIGAVSNYSAGDKTEVQDYSEMLGSDELFELLQAECNSDDVF